MSDEIEITDSEAEIEKTDSLSGPARLRKWLVAIAGAVLIIAAVWIGYEILHHPEEAAHSDTASADSGTVKFLMEQQWLIRMKLAKVEERTVARQIKSVGRVVPAPNSQALVSTPVAGILADRQLPQIGQFVSAGQSIAIVRQTATAAEEAQIRAAAAQVELQRLQAEGQNAQIAIENARLEGERREAAGEVEAARVRLDTARREAARERQLFEANVVSRRDMELAESERESAQAAFDAAQRTLAALTDAKSVLPPRTAPINPGAFRPGGLLTVSAPFGGYVTKVHKSIGEQVSPGDAIVEISNLNTVYVQAPIFERDLNVLQGGGAATFTTAAYPDAFKGSLVDIGSVIDENTRAANVLFAVENSGRALRLGMQANVQLDAEQTVTAMMIPKEAVLENDGRRIVYVLIGGEEFQRREVTIGDEYGDKIAVLSGLNPGERVVTQGAYQLKLQELSPADAGVHSHET